MTPSEKKASEIEAKRLLDLLGLIDMGITFLEQEQEAVSILAPALDAAERRGFERAKELVASLILNDGYAITFQTMGQYRTAIAKNIRSLTHDEA